MREIQFAVKSNPRESSRKIQVTSVNSKPTESNRQREIQVEAIEKSNRIEVQSRVKAERKPRVEAELWAQNRSRQSTDIRGRKPREN